MIDDVIPMRVSSLGLLLFLFMFLMPGCGGSGADSENQITYWPAANQQEIDLARVQVDDWNRQNPDFPVLMEPIPAGQSSEEVLLAAIAGRTTPDVCSNIWPGVMEQYVEAGAVVMLDTMAGFDSLFTSRIPENLREGYRSNNGHYFQIPWKSNPILPMYNARYFSILGVDSLPVSYSDYIEIARRVLDVAKKGETPLRWMHDPNIRPDWWQRFFDFYAFYNAASGGKTLLKDGEVDFDNEMAVKVFEFFATGYREKYLPKTVFQEDVFISQRVFGHVTGPWQISYLKKFAPELEYKFGALPRPDGSKGPAYTYADPKSLVIFSTTRHAGKAWEFIKFLVSRRGDRQLLDITAQLPIRDNMLGDSLFADYFTGNPKMTAFAKQIPYTVGLDKTIYLQEIFDIISQEYDAACLHQVKSPEEGIKDAAERVRNLLARERF